MIIIPTQIPTSQTTTKMQGKDFIFFTYERSWITMYILLQVINIQGNPHKIFWKNSTNLACHFWRQCIYFISTASRLTASFFKNYSITTNSTLLYFDIFTVCMQVATHSTVNSISSWHKNAKYSGYIFGSNILGSNQTYKVQIFWNNSILCLMPVFKVAAQHITWPWKHSWTVYWWALKFSRNLPDNHYYKLYRKKYILNMAHFFILLHISTIWTFLMPFDLRELHYN